ncbi:MAG: response regulator [Anaerolinea sp.]|nr:response regulator [Anaerolinea sp.]
MQHYLYVEDDQKSREIMRLMMERVVKDCTLTMLDSGIGFMENLAQLATCPTMILLDIQMHPFDGFTLLALLRADARYAAIPVVALTASVMNEEVEQLRCAGFSGVIAKPISPHTFPKLLTQLQNGEAVWYITD